VRVDSEFTDFANAVRTSTTQHLISKVRHCALRCDGRNDAHDVTTRKRLPCVPGLSVVERRRDGLESWAKTEVRGGSRSRRRRNRARPDSNMTGDGLLQQKQVSRRWSGAVVQQ